VEWRICRSVALVARRLGTRDRFAREDPGTGNRCWGRKGMRMSSLSRTENMTRSRSAQHSNHAPAFLFDFNGTLIDSVYPHVLAWHEALLKGGIELSVWRIHRRIGMSGGLLRETDRRLTEAEGTQLQQWHAEAYLRQLEQVRPLPGARDLLACLTRSGTKRAIATSGRMQTRIRQRRVGKSGHIPCLQQPGRSAVAPR
jgi:Haloacid dehalogenase-like hydrolase